MNFERVLTPSEKVFLNSASFTRSGAYRTSTDSPGGNIEQAIGTALEANEQVGNTKLEIRRVSRYFGLDVRNLLISTVIGRRALWPERTLEAQLLRDGRVADLIEEWIGKKASTQNQLQAKVVKDLISRGLIHKKEANRSGLLLRHSWHYSVPSWVDKCLEDSTWYPWTTIKGQISDEVHALLIDQIDKAFVRHFED